MYKNYITDLSSVNKAVNSDMKAMSAVRSSIKPTAFFYFRKLRSIMDFLI